MTEALLGQGTALVNIYTWCRVEKLCSVLDADVGINGDKQKNRLFHFINITRPIEGI
jgi:hypothetical protein